MVTFTRKRKIAAVTAAFVLVGGGAAYAYWSADGSGSGTAATGTSAGVTVIQTSTITAMGPGDAAQTLSGNFNNTSNEAVFVGTVTASISSVTGGEGACSATDYTLTGEAMTVDATVEPGVGGAWTGATIQFNNDPLVNQDGCKGATVNLAYAVS